MSDQSYDFEREFGTKFGHNVYREFETEMATRRVKTPRQKDPIEVAIMLAMISIPLMLLVLTFRNTSAEPVRASRDEIGQAVGQRASFLYNTAIEYDLGTAQWNSAQWSAAFSVPERETKVVCTWVVEGYTPTDIQCPDLDQ